MRESDLPAVSMPAPLSRAPPKRHAPRATPAPRTGREPSAIPADSTPMRGHTDPSDWEVLRACPGRYTQPSSKTKAAPDAEPEDDLPGT